MELKCDLSLSPKNFYMADVGGLMLKQARNPQRLAQSLEAHAPTAQGLVPVLIWNDKANPIGEQRKIILKDHEGGSLPGMPYLTMPEVSPATGNLVPVARCLHGVLSFLSLEGEGILACLPIDDCRDRVGEGIWTYLLALP